MSAEFASLRGNFLYDPEKAPETLVSIELESANVLAHIVQNSTEFSDMLEESVFVAGAEAGVIGGAGGMRRVGGGMGGGGESADGDGDDDDDDAGVDYAAMVPAAHIKKVDLEACVGRIVGMGFDSAQVRNALELCSGVEEDAVSYLLSGGS
jgi:hypothetical protein